MTQLYRILDRASGTVLGIQAWDDPQAPVVLGWQTAVPVNTSKAVATGAFSATGTGAAVSLQGNFNIVLWGAFTGQVALERTFDGGVTYVPAAFADGSTAAFSAPMSGTWAEKEPGVAYRMRCTRYTSGTINWRISQ